MIWDVSCALKHDVQINAWDATLSHTSMRENKMIGGSCSFLAMQIPIITNKKY
jgi:hypothetical protein